MNTDDPTRSQPAINQGLLTVGSKVILGPKVDVPDNNKETMLSSCIEKCQLYQKIIQEIIWS